MASNCTAAQAAACKSAGMSCPSKGVSASAASVTAMSADHCAGKISSASAASCRAHASASSAAACKGAAAAAAASAAAMAPHCRGEGLVKVADASVHADCEGCADMARCAQEIAAAGARVQVVPLKNGVMYVYTADNPRNVRAVQAAVAQRTERINALATANNAKLCPDCKQMRGAMASGKLSREVVNIDGGSISLVTSTDPRVVARLYEMAGLTQKGIKS
jgi:hypothetical protein